MVVIALEPLEEESVNEYREIIEQTDEFEEMVERFERVGGDIDDASIRGTTAAGGDQSSVTITYKDIDEDDMLIELACSLSQREHMKRNMDFKLKVSPDAPPIPI